MWIIGCDFIRVSAVSDLDKYDVEIEERSPSSSQAAEFCRRPKGRCG